MHCVKEVPYITHDVQLLREALHFGQFVHELIFIRQNTDRLAIFLVVSEVLHFLVIGNDAQEDFY